jgi:hypothetical protein
MNMIPVPSRIFKQISTWILIVLAVGDAAHIVLDVLFNNQLLTAAQLASVNAILGAVATAAKLVQQNIKLTEEQKETLIESVANAPTKPAKGGDTQAPEPS